MCQQPLPVLDWTKEWFAREGSSRAWYSITGTLCRRVWTVSRITTFLRSPEASFLLRCTTASRPRGEAALGALLEVLIIDLAIEQVPPRRLLIFPGFGLVTNEAFLIIVCDDLTLRALIIGTETRATRPSTVRATSGDTPGGGATRDISRVATGRFRKGIDHFERRTRRADWRRFWIRRDTFSAYWWDLRTPALASPTSITATLMCPSRLLAHIPNIRLILYTTAALCTLRIRKLNIS